MNKLNIFYKKDNDFFICLDNMTIKIPPVPFNVSTKYRMNRRAVICKHNFQEQRQQIRSNDEECAIIYICINCNLRKTK